MKPGEAAVRLRVQVAAEDAHAHAGLVVGLVGILFGIFVPRFRGYSVVVFAPAHGSKVAPIVHNGVRLLSAKCRSKTPALEGHPMRKCLYQGMEQRMSFLIHSPDLSFCQEPGPVQHVPVQELIVRFDHPRERVLDPVPGILLL